MATDVPDWTKQIAGVVGLSTSDLQDWVQAIAVAGGGGIYASLTGAGQSATPGDLTQAGGFVVNDSGDGIQLNGASTHPTLVTNSGAGGVQITSPSSAGGITITSHDTINLTQTTLTASPGIELDTTSTASAITIQAGAGGVNITSSAGTVTLNTNTVRVSGSSLGFYGHAAGVQPTVTGSRGGNAALASLLTALNGLGLIVDSSTP